MKAFVRTLVASSLAAALLVIPVAGDATDDLPDAEPVPPVVEQSGVDVGPRAEPAVEVDPGRQFELVGVTWDREDATSAAPVQVRVRDLAGGWSEWTTLGLAEDPAQPGTVEAAASRPATELLWVGHAEAVQVRSVTARDLGPARVEMIDPGTSRNDAAVATSPAGAAYAALPGQPPIVTRAEWGADESLRNCTPTVSPTLKAAVVHHTVGSNTYSASESAAVVRGIYAFHTQSRGWCDVGYNYLVDRFGTIFEGRYGGVDQNVIGAQVGGFNTSTLGVSMMGTFTDVAPPAATVEAIARLLAWRLGSMYIDPSSTVALVSAGNSKYPAGATVTVPRIVGHRDLYQTECPGNTGYQSLPTIRARVQALVGASFRDSPIYQRWQALGGSGGTLGDVFVGEKLVAGGLSTQFRTGSLHWSAATGVQPTMYGNNARYTALGGPASSLGFPTSAE